MKERDSGAARAGSDAGRDGFDPFSFRAGQCDLDVLDVGTDVVDARTTAFEEAGNGGIVAHGGQQLDPSASVAEERDVDPLGLDGLAAGGLHPEQLGPPRNGFFERVDRDSDVVDYGRFAGLVVRFHATGTLVCYITGETDADSSAQKTYSRRKAVASEPRGRLGRERLYIWEEQNE